jgi:ribosomal protein L22
MGRAAPIRKRTTHINLTLAPASEITYGKKKAKKIAAMTKAKTASKGKKTTA